MDDYFLANRSISGWAMGLSSLATIITSVTFIIYPDSAYAGDWSMLVPRFMFVVVLILAGSASIGSPERNFHQPCINPIRSFRTSW